MKHFHFLSRVLDAVLAKLSPPRSRAVQHVLQGDDPRFAALVAQLQTTPAVNRGPLHDQRVASV